MPISQIVIDETTSSVVKEIFSLYVNGKSLLDISSLLNNMCIEYRPGVIGWNKARIKRIIEDKRYLGEKDYPIIISEDLADKANNLKTRKNTQSNIDKDNLIYRLDAPVYCPCCNTLMKRIYEPRNKIPERWRCENSECHHIIPIADTDLLSELQQLLNSIIINPDMIESHVSENYISMETFRTENEINHLLDSRSISKDIVKAKLYEAIAHKVKQIGTKTELGKYSSKYALTELLVCGECGSPYRRCTWTASGNKRIVWRCINRLDYGKKYCHDSPTIEESTLHKAITEAIKTIAMQNTHLLQTLKTHIAMNMEREEKEDRSIDIKVRIAEIDNKFKSLLSSLSVDLENNSQTEQAIAELMTEKRTLEKELEKYKTCGASTSHESKLNEVCHITELIENQPLQFDDNLIRQMLECVVVLSKEQIKIVFKDGTEIDQSLT